MTLLEYLKEEWHDSIKADGFTVEIFKNPSRGDIKNADVYGVRGVLIGQNLFVWSVGTQHHLVLDRLIKNRAKAVPIIIKGNLVIVSSCMMKSKSNLCYPKDKDKIKEMVKTNKNILQFIGKQYKVEI